MENPDWLKSIIESYDSGARNVFVLHGNIQDIFPGKKGPVSLRDFLVEKTGSKREIVVVADPAEGVKALRGGELVGNLISSGKAPAEIVGKILLYLSNLPEAHHAAVIFTNADTAFGKDATFDALLAKRWAEDPHLRKDSPFIALIADSHHSLHELVRECTRIEPHTIPFPGKPEIQGFLEANKEKFPKALEAIQTTAEKETLADALAGTSIEGLEGLLKKREFTKKPLHIEDLSHVKREIVSRESKGMLEFLPSNLTLQDLTGESANALREQFEGDIALWKSGRTDLAPNGYLLCGPPGTGKTFFVRCLSGSAGIPVLRINNFRGEYQGSTENNLELVFRLAKSLPRVYLFIDEAEQWLGGRSQSNTDGGVSGRVYSYFADQMSDITNKGRICWILATSHPHLLELDLKRAGRLDVKIPLFPCANKAEGERLLRAICKKREVSLPEHTLEVPDLLTPGGADTIASDILRRQLKNPDANKEEVAALALKNYQSANVERTLELIEYAKAEASSKEFIPKNWQEKD